jgi:uncharacterized protein (TIGR00369 family)
VATPFQSILERFRQALADGVQPMALADTLGFRVASVDPGEVAIEMDASPRHHNPMGTVHGGVLSSIADSAMGMAHSSTLEPGETTTTLELKINFLRPVFDGKLRAVGKVIKGGRTISLLECEVFDGAGRLVAKSSSTCMTLRGDQAAGRQGLLK